MSINPSVQLERILANLPKPITIRSMRSSAQPITIKSTETGLLFYRGQNVVAWLVEGHHNGQHESVPVSCSFYDVAYFRRTQKGINLETSDHLTLQDAFTFTMQVIGGES